MTVLAFGDSLMQGFGLPEQDGFVPQLSRWLQGHGAEARVINGGVSGDTTAGGAARVEWSLTPDIDVMIVALGGNDMLRGIDPGVSRRNLSKILDAARVANVRVLLIGLHAPDNFGPEFKAAYNAMFPQLAQEYGTLYYENFLKPLGKDGPENVLSYLQPDHLHPNAAGVTVIVAAIGPLVLELIQPQK